MLKNSNETRVLQFLLPSRNFEEFNKKVQSFISLFNLGGLLLYDNEFHLTFASGVDPSSFATLSNDVLRLQDEGHNWNLFKYKDFSGSFKRFHFGGGEFYTLVVIYSQFPFIKNPYVDFFAESLVREIILFNNLTNDVERFVRDIALEGGLNILVFESEEKGSSKGLQILPSSSKLIRKAGFSCNSKLNILSYQSIGLTRYRKLKFLNKLYLLVGKEGKELKCVNFLKWQKIDFTIKDIVRNGKIVKVSNPVGFYSIRAKYNFDLFLKEKADFPQLWQEVFGRQQVFLDASVVKQFHPLLMIVKNKDLHTYLHLKNVARLLALISEKLGLNSFEIFKIQLAGLLHDVGKIVLPLELITKPQPLVGMEMEMVKLHVSYSVDILKDFDEYQEILPFIKQHHERNDGSGYPEGLKSDQILLGSHILIVADIVDAMSSDRPYRRRRSLTEIEAELEAGKDVKYHGEIVEVVLRTLTETNLN